MSEKLKKEEKIKQLQKDYPNVPIEIYDIEASVEIAVMYQDIFGC